MRLKTEFRRLKKQVNRLKKQVRKYKRQAKDPKAAMAEVETQVDNVPMTSVATQMDPIEHLF